MISEICSFPSLPHKYFSSIFNDELILYQVDEKLFAISSFCPHFGGPLEVKGGKINCYWHDWDFDLQKHNCVNKKVNLSVRPYQIVRISSNEALIQNVN